MNAFRLRWKTRPAGLIDGSALTPQLRAKNPNPTRKRGENPPGAEEFLADASGYDQIRECLIPCGRREYRVADLFEIEQLPEQPAPFLQVEGADNFIRLGAGWSAGTLQIDGPAGALAGMKQSGGKIIVNGSVGARAGAGMSGGRLIVQGDAGDLLGGPLPGDPIGITGGAIVMHGSAGDYVGLKQRRGLIAVSGSLGAYPAFRMLGGTLVAGGRMSGPGFGMEGGTIVALSPISHVWPTFRRGAVSQPVFLRLLWRRLAELGFSLPHQIDDAAFLSQAGDFLYGGSGEVWQNLGGNQFDGENWME